MALNGLQMDLPLGVEAVVDLEAEFATPPWVFGMQQYAFAAPDRILCAFTRKGAWSLASLAA